MNPASYNIYSISQVTNQVKFSLEKNFSNIYIKAEVGSYKLYPSGHIYMTLKDKTAELSAVLFSQYVKSINHHPTIGMEVVVFGNLSIYASRGQFQLHVRNIYLSGEGELWVAFESLRKRLKSEGVFDNSKKKTLPSYPEKIGIITSSEGAALKDILNVIQRRAPYIKCCIFPVPVQGNMSADKIAEGIDLMNLYGKVNVLIVGRGGGSMEDLWSFNEEKVVRAIYDSNIPIISAVGHEGDITLSDYAADCIAPTPSAAAEIVAINQQEIVQNLDHIEIRCLQIIKKRVEFYYNKIDSIQKQHGFFKPRILIENCKNNLMEKRQKLNRIMIEKIGIKKDHISTISNKLEILNPDLQLQRGYALVLDEQNKVINNVSKIDIGEVFNIRFSNGKIKAQVLEREESNGE